MVAYYSIFGRQVGSHYLAIGVLGSIFGGIIVSSGSKKAPAPSTAPPINAASSDETDFITKFLAEADKKQ